MTRLLGHLLLIAVLLACPVQCVTGAAACCASASTAADSSLANGSSHACCHQHGNEKRCESQTEAGSAAGHSSHFPVPDENCQCDCLCRGAVPASAMEVEGVASSLVHPVMVAGIDSSITFFETNAPPSGIPKPPSGREIRTLRMSFQV